MSFTGKAVAEETSADWDARFASADWSRAGGNLQSLLFMHHAVAALLRSPLGPTLAPFMKPALYEDGTVEGPKLRIADYGCAEGDGTAFLQAVFPLCEVTGYDFSPAAVQRASARWPTLKFACGDLSEPESADIIFSLHALEHQANPASVLAGLRKVAQYVVIAVPPLEVGRHFGGHDGAPTTSSWLNERTPGILFTSAYNTFRVSGDEVFPEGNVVAVIRGVND